MVGPEFSQLSQSVEQTKLPLQEWIVWTWVNHSGVGDDDPALIEAVA
jgi:hypothetical protein